MTRNRSLPRPATVLAMLALFVALGGSANAAGLIGSSKLKSGAVTTSKLANGAVTTAKLRTAAVDATRLKNGAVTSAKIASGAVGGSQIAAGAITAAKLAPGVAVAGPGRIISISKTMTAPVFNVPLASSPGFFTLTANCTAPDTITYLVTNTSSSLMVARLLVGVNEDFPVLNPGQALTFSHSAGANEVDMTFGNAVGGHVATVHGFDSAGPTCEVYAQGLTTG